MYESELYELFVKEIKNMYGIEKEDKAYKYFKLRFLIYNLDKNKKDINTTINIANFLLSELNIPTNNSCFIYKNREVLLLDTIYNIIENWEFRASLIKESDRTKNITHNKKLLFDEFINKTYDKIVSIAKRKAKKISNKKEERLILSKYIGIKELNKLFNVSITLPNQIKEINYSNDYNPYKRTIDERLDSFVSHINITSKLNLISENDFENYMLKNIEKIEKGLKYIDRQVAVDGGRIDILAKDKNNVYVILELKVDEDKEIVWQCIYYPDAIKKKYKINKVRMITLCPEYEPHIFSTLKKLNLEMFQYEISSNFSEIKDVTIFKV